MNHNEEYQDKLWKIQIHHQKAELASMNEKEDAFYMKLRV